jgi:catechol 2,3-dioxygenase-like lactoylglutathione lyase family enzyme
MLAFDEMTLVVNDLTAALEFYSALLGFEVIGRDDRNNREAAYLTLGKFRLKLIRPPAKRMLPPPNAITLTFLTDNFEQIRQNLQGKVDIAEHKPTTWTHGRTLVMRDPAGYTISIVENAKGQDNA